MNICKNSIAIYSDLICPWCYIGKRRMEEALRRLPPNTILSPSWRPFQLNPDLPPDGLNRKIYRSKKFGSWERSQAMDAQVAAAGRSVGIEFRCDLQTHTPNTFDSHRLIWLAGVSGVQGAVVEALFHAYFCEGANFSDRKKLIEIGVSAGLDASRMERSFASDESASAVREEEQQARMLGISGVPFYLINQTVSFSGAQLAETFLDAVRRTQLPDKQPANASPDDTAQACGPDGCEVPK
jgi:predicted DsbA family dithiol-disulfide isomerase